jgi:hypothetical protein
MAKISNKTTYPIDPLVTMDDFLIGTDSFDDSTKSYPIGSLAELFLENAIENIASINQSNQFKFIDHSFNIGGINQDISSVKLKETAILQEIDSFLLTNNLTVLETELIVFNFTITERETMFTHKRKYLAPNTMTKGTYAPLSSEIAATDLEIVYVESNLRTASPQELAQNIGNVIYDLGYFTNLDYLNYLNTVYNPNFPNGYDLTDNSKVYYFKYIDNEITYLYSFNESVSMNGYGSYGYSGNYLFGTNDLVLYYNSDVSQEMSTAITKTSELQNTGSDETSVYVEQDDLDAELLLLQYTSEKGQPNGYASLDSFGKLTFQHLNVVNDLIAGGATSILSAEQGKVLKVLLDASTLAATTALTAEATRAIGVEATKENTANKSTDETLLSNSDIKFPTEKATKTYIDNQNAAKLAEAKAYADTQDTTKLNQAKAYSDTQDAAKLIEAKAYADNLISSLTSGELTYDTLLKIANELRAQRAIIGGITADGDTVVNTVTELLQVFATFPEGVDLVTLLAGKVNTTDIYNALDSIVAGKTLDARQGKVLNDLIVTLRTDVNTNTSAISTNTTNIVLNTANTTTNTTAIGLRELLSNKSQDVEADKLSTTKFASVKALYDWAVAKFQTILVSGTTIKTINGTTLLGSGDMIIVTDISGKADKVIQVAAQTLLAASWTLVSGFYEYNLANANITEESVVDVIPDNASISAIKQAEILPQTLSSLGTVKFFATNEPINNIVVTINIWK